FVPCNGRFPTLISILTMFFAGMFIKPWNTIFSTLLLTSIVMFGIFLTLIVSKFLSATLLKGLPSSFTLELPPFRKPQIGKVILRSIMDRTLFVLGRAISVAIPAGAIIWLLANIQYMDVSLLAIIANYLDPFAGMMGLDGVILLAFILGFPANEIVVPIIIMAYLANGSMSDMNNLVVLKELFVNNGWTWLTALCTMIFSLAHFPCATTLLTIYKETKSKKWTLISFLLPTIIGILLCMCVNGIGQFFI
ncbi:MAG: nucleoside recognition domain-containing protein, partial [Longicatena sp.]